MLLGMRSRCRRENVALFLTRREKRWSRQRVQDNRDIDAFNTSGCDLEHSHPFTEPVLREAPRDFQPWAYSKFTTETLLAYETLSLSHPRWSRRRSRWLASLSTPQEEIRQALDVHKTHLACLVARCAMVSRWAGDPTVQAAMVSCLPGHLLSKVACFCQHAAVDFEGLVLV